MRPDSPPYAAAARRHLTEADPALARVIAEIGPVKFVHRRERFPALVRAIIFQQLAGAAAAAILERFIRATGAGRFPTPAQVLAASDETLRAAGLSRGKMAYLRDLATHVQNGSINFHRFPRMSDDEIVEHLTAVNGIGRWTAEMFLMFNLLRPDVLPVGDLGVRNAAGRLYAMAKPPTPTELREIGERWRPFRSAASWYLWQSLRIVTPDTPAPAAPKPRRKVKT